MSEIFKREDLPFGYSVAKYYSKVIPNKSTSDPLYRTMRVFIGSIPKSLTQDQIKLKIEKLYKGVGDKCIVKTKLFEKGDGKGFAFAKIQVSTPNHKEFENVFSITTLAKAVNSTHISRWRGPDPAKEFQEKPTSNFN